MTSNETSEPASIPHLIFIPALISLFISVLRVVGELMRWSPQWFSTETSGVVPSGSGWLIGITWLPFPFGVYFAWKLVRAGHGPPSAAKSVGYALAGIALFTGVNLFVLPRLSVPFPQILIQIWLLMMAAAIIQLLGWPELFKTMLAYGLMARAPVIIVMFLAMQGDWGTHYDYVGMPEQFQMSLWPKFFWLAFFPQLLFWVGYTILAGALTGGIAAAIFHFLRKRATAQEVKAQPA